MLKMQGLGCGGHFLDAIKGTYNRLQDKCGAIMIMWLVSVQNKD